jgi:hypothetical protein
LTILNIDPIWLVVVVVVAVAFGLVIDRTVNRWRLAAVSACFLGAMGTAYQAIFGIDSPLLLERFGPSIVIGARILCGVIAVWATYLGVEQVRAWMRGDPD